MSEAILMPMGKGFAITSDLNLGRMLLSGYSRHCDAERNGHIQHSPSERHKRRRGMPKLPRLRIAAITNDAVATFAASAYLVKAAPMSRTAMGLIVGTGCNATVPMKLGTLHPSKQKSVELPADASLEKTTIVINTEWTIRGTDVPMKEVGIPTVWDETLDRNSEYPGFQPFEYMTAGRYLGEIVRLVFVDLAAAEPDSALPKALLKKNAITTTFLATTVASADDASLLAKLTEMFPASEGGSFSWDQSKMELLREIASAVQVRASALIAAAIVGLLACIGEIQLDSTNGTDNAETGKEASESLQVQEELVVAYTGRTIAGYPGFLETCQSWIDKLISNGSSENSSRKVILKETLDGGIIGAAVLAGMTPAP
jgi:hexokinase